jgi:hypothetical protein
MDSSETHRGILAYGETSQGVIPGTVRYDADETRPSIKVRHACSQNNVNNIGVCSRRRFWAYPTSSQDGRFFGFMYGLGRGGRVHVCVVDEDDATEFMLLTVVVVAVAVMRFGGRELALRDNVEAD